MSGIIWPSSERGTKERRVLNGSALRMQGDRGPAKKHNDIYRYTEDMMNKNTAILDNTMMDAYLTVTEGVSDNCGIGLAFASLLESAKKNFVNQSNRRAVNASFAG